jgi:hypothetical protein
VFYASRPGAVTGPLVDQSEIVADFRDPAIQQHADKAIHHVPNKPLTTITAFSRDQCGWRVVMTSADTTTLQDKKCEPRVVPFSSSNTTWGRPAQPTHTGQAISVVT